MRKTVEIVLDSFTKKEIKGEYEEVYLAVDNQGWQLQLTEDSARKLMEAIDPFIAGEDSRTTPKEHYCQAAPSKKAKSEGITASDRQDIAAFVAKQKLGKVAQRGRIKAEFVQAWEAAGKPRA